MIEITIKAQTLLLVLEWLLFALSVGNFVTDETSTYDRFGHYLFKIAEFIVWFVLLFASAILVK
jgi:hypothetical protein